MSVVRRELPEYPWDLMTPYRERAAAHPEGVVDLSIGSPVDPTPEFVQRALAEGADAHAYPATVGTPDLREAIVEWFARRRGVSNLSARNVIPTGGSKELVALLPFMLGLGAGDVVVHPRAAYPSYAMGASLVGATALAADDPADWPAETKLIWINSPGNPDGRVLTIDELRAARERAIELDAIIVGDECYAELGWSDQWADAATPSLLDPRVANGSRRNTLVAYSLSKQSNMAGYRTAFLVGCGELIEPIATLRKHAGLMLAAPLQAAMVAALGDDAHVAEQKSRYRRRREVLRTALVAAGFRIDHSEAGLYLWATEGRDAWHSIGRLADLGIVAGPGHFYGEQFPDHIRVSITASDERVDAAAERLRAASAS